jgi:tripartite-type tricarboxylate transporter receptor subunit TctC
MAQPAADNYPQRTIRIIVPFAAGGPTDVLARLIGQQLSDDFKQSVVIENRVGGNSIVGAQFVAQSPPDGYTLMMTIDSTLVMNQFLYRRLSYDPINDFVPITLTAKNTVFLMVNTDSSFKTVKDLIAYDRANPGKLNYGAGAITNQLQGFVFNKLANVKSVMVPYNGTTPMEQALLSHTVDYIYASGTQLVEAGNFRALVKLDERPFPKLPNVPSISTELPGFGEIFVWLGVVAPKGTPQPIIDKLHRHVTAMLNDPQVRERMTARGLFVATSASPAEFGSFIRQEADRWSGVIKESGIKLD